MLLPLLLSEAPLSSSSVRLPVSVLELLSLYQGTLLFCFFLGCGLCLFKLL
jgi:hypothetical protein